MFIQYSKHICPVCSNYVTYFKHSKKESVSFQIAFDENGDVKYISSMTKIISEDDKNFYVNKDAMCNATKEEYEVALSKLIEFLKRDEESD